MNNRKIITFQKAGVIILSALIMVGCGLVGQNGAPASLAPTLSLSSPSALPALGAGTPGGIPGTGGQAGQAGSPQPGPDSPLVIPNQSAAGGQVIIDRVESSGPGWVVIHRQDPDGLPGDIIGYTAVKAGVSQQVSVKVDSSKITPFLIAELHKDAGKPGVFEYPGPDVPMVSNGKVILAVFSTAAAALPPGAGSAVPTASAKAATPGATLPGGLDLGGLNATATAVALGQINASAGAGASQSLSASGTPAPSGANAVSGTPTPTVGLPIVPINQVTIMPSAAPATQVTTPLVTVYDQQASSQVVINEVISTGPAWVAVYSVSKGRPVQNIGFTHVPGGDITALIVHLKPGMATARMEVILHTDAGQVGKFEYPGPDQPVMVGQQVVAAQFTNTAFVAPVPSNPGSSNKSKSTKPTAARLPTTEPVVEPTSPPEPTHPPEGSPGGF